jgi:RNA polymerase sigma-70 factor (ECF subfamily)
MDAEQSLLAKALRFDESALTEVYDCYCDGLYRYAWRLLGSEDLAEECVAETFSRFLNAIKSGGGPRRHLKAYLFRTAHNWITDQYRRQPAPALPLDQVQAKDVLLNPSNMVMSEMERQDVRAALANLTQDQRQVIVLRYLEDWPLKDISIALEKPVGAVKALQHRGINALRRLLIKQEGEN